MKAEKLQSAYSVFLRVLLLFLLGILCACKEQIVHDLEEGQANRLLAALHEVRVDVEKVKQADGRFALAVPKSQMIPAIKYMRDRRLLREGGPSQRDTTSLVPDRNFQRLQYERDLSREISYTLSGLDHVLAARVHLHLPPRDPLFGNVIAGSEKGSASVVVVADGEFLRDKNEIAALVAGASGIPVSSISVMISKNESALKKSTLTLPIQAELPGRSENTVFLLLSENLAVQIAVSLLIALVGLLLLRSHLSRYRRQSKLNHIAKAFEQNAVGGAV